MLTGAPGALVKQLKMERKSKDNIKSNTFSNFKKLKYTISKKIFQFIIS